MKTLFRSVLALSPLVIPLSVLAATNLSNPQEVLGTILKIAGIMGQFLIALSVIVILYAGFQYMTAAGDEQKVTDATKTVTYAIVGIIVGMFAFAIPAIVTSLFK